MPYQGSEDICTPELVDRIITGVATGKTITAVCRDDPALPEPLTVFRWLHDSPEAGKRYREAMLARTDVMHEQIIDISDETARDYIETDSGPKLNPEHIQRSRLRVNTRQWLMERMQPKKYGSQLSISGSVELTARADVIGRLMQLMNAPALPAIEAQAIDITGRVTQAIEIDSPVIVDPIAPDALPLDDRSAE